MADPATYPVETCDVIIKRWQDFTGQDAIYEPTGQTYQEMANVTKAA
jgi:hypothetical protein